MKLYTDYPIIELGDKPHVEAPIRECGVVAYDGDKYVHIEVEGCKELIEVKTFYVYNKEGRCGDVENISGEDIDELILEYKLYRRSKRIKTILNK